MPTVKSKAGLAATVLMLSAACAALHADEQRIFANQSKAPWQVAIKADPEGKAEVANMNFFRDGKQVAVLGVSGGSNTVDLPAGSRFEVEFTHTNNAFHHYFRVTDGQGRWAEFCADRPFYATSLTHAPVALAWRRTSLAPNTAAAVQPYLTLNSPVAGNLTLLADGFGPPPPPPVQQPNQGVKGFTVTNETEALWTIDCVTPPGLKQVGRCTVAMTDGKVLDLTLAGLKVKGKAPRAKPPRLEAQLIPDASGSYDLCLRMAHAKLGHAVLRVRSVPGQLPPHDLEITQLEATFKGGHSWVLFTCNDDLVVKLADPEEEATFTVK